MKFHQKTIVSLSLILMLNQFGIMWGGSLDGKTEDSPPPPASVNGEKSFTVPLLIAGSVAIGGFAIYDRSIRRQYLPHRNDRSTRDLRKFGDVGQLAGPIVGSLFVVHYLATGHKKSGDSAFLAFESFLVAGGLSEVIKYSIGRSRPSAINGDADVFKPGSTGSSFPSGHTTTAFAAATIFSEQYPHPAVMIPCFALASLVGYSRLRTTKHWGSDVAAGAVLGIGVAHYLRWHHQQSDHHSWSMQLTGNGVKVSKKF